MATARWMFADAGVLSQRMARMNPLRWSSRGSLQDAIAALAETAAEAPGQRSRPVRLELRDGSGARCELLSCASVEAAVAQLRGRCAGASAAAVPGAGGAGADGDALTPASRHGCAPPFRCEDRAKIPDELLQGPFQELVISEDVYSTAYLIARNATEDMYSIWPWANRQVIVVWLYMIFIVGSQLFAIAAITLWYPLGVQTERTIVDCGNATSLAPLRARGFIDEATGDECRRAGEIAFWTNLHGTQVAYYSLEMTTPFHRAVLMEGGCMVHILRLVCCTWVFSQIYFQHFVHVRSLIEYHDFSRWFLPLKGTETRNNWAVCVAFIQYFVLMVDLTVSVVVISAQGEPFDIVMNSMAFTFIAEVGRLFNTPLVQQMASTKIDGCIYGDVFYLYPEYAESNAVREDGTYTDEGWYILQDEEKAGMLSDYKVRHNPGVYPRRSETLASALSWALVVVPTLVTLLAAAHSRLAEPARQGIPP